MHCLSRVVGADAHIGPCTELTDWGSIVETYLLRIPGIDTYVIMPNHVHMIVRIESGDGPMWASAPTQSVSDRIRSFKTLVSKQIGVSICCLLYTSDAADELEGGDLGGRRIIK